MYKQMASWQQTHYAVKGSTPTGPGHCWQSWTQSIRKFKHRLGTNKNRYGYFGDPVQMIWTDGTGGQEDRRTARLTVF
jgi:hypothetical protein